MKRNLWRIGLIIGLLGICLSAAPASAQGIKERMRARLPIIKALKSRQIIGESNRGYLEFVGSKKERQDVVNAENSDRRTVYSAIARQQGTTVGIVEKHRAVQIHQKAARGEWLQDAGGRWHIRQ